MDQTVKANPATVVHQTLLFDMDGTLVDSAEGVFQSLAYAMKSVVGLELSRDEVRHFLGTPVEQVLQERFGCGREAALRVRECYLSHYRDHGLYATVPAPGMVELAKRLKAAGFRLAVATCKPWVYCDPILEQCGFSGCFEAVAGSCHNGVPEEKDAVIREALRLLEAPAETAIMIGDRAADVDGARACGIPCVGVEFCGYADPGELAGAGAVAVVHTTGELERFLTGRTEGGIRARFSAFVERTAEGGNQDVL